MPGTHGDLFREIGALVVAAHGGESFDLRKTSEELARCYVNLGVPAQSIERAIARSMAAVGVSMALMRSSEHQTAAREAAPSAALEDEASELTSSPDGEAERSSAVVFPSGVRLAMLS